MDASPEASPAHRPDAGRTDRSADPSGPSRGTPPEGALPARVALCLHRTAPGTAGHLSQPGLPSALLDHVDLFIGPADPAAEADDDARIAQSWRLPSSARDWSAALRSAGTIRWPVVATPAHRALYLRLERPRTLDGGRGIVEPLAAGDGWMMPRPGHLVAEARLAPVDHPGAAIALRVEVREDAGGATAAFSLIDRGEGTVRPS